MKLETSATVGVSDDLKHETGCTGNDRDVGTSKTPIASCIQRDRTEEESPERPLRTYSCVLGNVFG